MIIAYICKGLLHTLVLRVSVSLVKETEQWTISSLFLLMRKSAIWKYNDFPKITKPIRGWTKTYSKASSKPVVWFDEDSEKRRTFVCNRSRISFSVFSWIPLCPREKSLHLLSFCALICKTWKRILTSLFPVFNKISHIKLAHRKFLAHIHSVEMELIWDC